MMVTHRPFSQDDEAFVHELIGRVVADDLGAGMWPDAMREPLIEIQCRARQRSIGENWPGSEQEIVLVDDRPAGWVVVARHEEAIHLVDIIIRSEHRGRGIGTHRIQELLAESDRTGKPVRLSVATTNRAHRLYERLGFQRTGGDEVRHFMERRVQAAGGARDFSQFRLLVLCDAALQAELRAIPDSAALFARVLELGRQRGYRFSEQDLAAAAHANRRAWLERWLDQ